MAGSLYGTSRIPKLRESFCAFLDILGFQSLTKDAGETFDDSMRLLKRLTKALRLSREWNDSAEFGGKIWMEKTFTDNLLIAYPFNEEDPDDWNRESAWGGCITACARHQFALTLNKGFAVRGGIVSGLVHVSRAIVFGPALLSSYHLEQQKSEAYPLGSPPRVLLSDEVIEYAL